MFKKIILSLSALIVFITFSFCEDAVQNQTSSRLYPPLQPYQTGYLKVSDLHEIFYQLGGNPDGKPVMYLHGGPGAGCSTHDFQYFNPQKYHIILHDQRGSGQSKPYAELKENTTPNLVEDIDKLRNYLGLGKVVLFGGSWGTTLALAYAETYPQNVSGIILRGVFTATKDEIDHFYHGATATYFPENFEMLRKHIDNPDQKNYPVQLLAKIQNPDSIISHDAARAWARYEGKLAFLDMPDQRLEMILHRWPFFAFSLIENYFMTNQCFLEEGQLLTNADKLIDIPMIIVNGRYDVICPPITAYKLHQKLPKSKLWIIEGAGHSASEPGIEAALVKAVKEFE